MSARRLLAPIVALALLAACGGDDDDSGAEPSGSVPANNSRCLDAEEADRPRVDLVADAMSAVADHYGGPQEYFEISADRKRVSLIVATDTGDAEQSFYCGDAGFGAPESLGPASGTAFEAADVVFDADAVLSGIEDELTDPEIIDFVVQGAPDGVIYDATVRSDAGGILLVLVGPDGAVLAVQTS